MAKSLGAKPHPASGALRIKHDASDHETLYEIKDANKTHTIKGTELTSLWKEATMAEKRPVYVVRFRDADMVLYCSLSKGGRA